MSIESPNETGPEPDGGASLPETAKNVTSHAGEQAKQVAGEAKEQVREVATDLKEHATDVLDQTRSQVRQQAEQSTQHLASGLHGLSQQIRALREGRPEEAGSISSYAERAGQRLEDMASRLDRGGLDAVASDLGGFARRRPGLFLLSCAAAGFALARIVRAGGGGAEGVVAGRGGPAGAEPDYRTPAVPDTAALSAPPRESAFDEADPAGSMVPSPGVA